MQPLGLSCPAGGQSHKQMIRADVISAGRGGCKVLRRRGGGTAQPQVSPSSCSERVKSLVPTKKEAQGDIDAVSVQHVISHTQTYITHRQTHITFRKTQHTLIIHRHIAHTHQTSHADLQTHISYRYHIYHTHDTCICTHLKTSHPPEGWTMSALPPPPSGPQWKHLGAAWLSNVPAGWIVVVGGFLCLTMSFPSAFSLQAADSLGCPTITMATVSLSIFYKCRALLCLSAALTSTQPGLRLCNCLSGLFQGLSV